MKRKLLGVIMAMVMVLSIAMPSLAAIEITEPVTITLWHTLEEMYREDFGKLVDQFMAENPNIKVEVEYQGRVGEILQKVLAANVAGSDVLPGVFPVHSSEIKNLARDGVVTNLDALIEQDETNLENMLMKDVYGFEESQYGLTWTLTGISAFYNNTLMQNEGLAYPQTWADMDGFLRAATLKNDDGTTKRYGMWLPGWDSYYFTWMFWNQGVIDIDEQGNTTINSEKAAKIVNQVKQWVDEGLVMWGYGADASSNMRSAFWDEGVVSIFHTSSQYQNHRDNMAEKGYELGVAMPPAGDVMGTTEVFGMSLSIPEKLDEALKPAAYKLLAYLTSREVNRDMAFFTGFLANHSDALESAEGEAWLAQNPAMESLYSRLGDMKTAVQVNGYAAITDVLENGLAMIFLEGADVKSELDNMADEITAIYQDQ